MEPSSKSQKDTDRCIGKIAPHGEFFSLISKAEDLFNKGKIEESIHVAQDAQSLISQIKFPDNLEIANAFNNLGIIFFSTGYKRNALSAYENALSMLKRLKTPEKDLLASVYNNLGQAEFQFDNYKKAKSYLENALSIREEISPDSMNLGIVLDNLASVYALYDDIEKAESMHKRALSIFERLCGPFDRDVATTLGNLSNIYLRKKDFEKAEAYRLRALNTHERSVGLRHSETLIDYRKLAEIYIEKGDENRADYFVNLLLSMVSDKPCKDDRYLAEMLYSLMQSAFNYFRLDLAERLGKRAIELFEVVEGKQAPETLNTVNLLANVQRATKHIEPAQKNFEKALEGYKNLKMHKESIDVIISLGKIHQEKQAYPIAQKWFEKAIQQLKQFPEQDSQLMSSALGNLALFYYNTQKYNLADEYYEKAFDVIKEDKKNIERPLLLHNRAMLKYHLGEYEAAIKMYDEAKQIWTAIHGNEHPFVATTAANLALLYWATGNLKEAISSFSEAEASRDRQMQRILTIGSEVKRIAYARSLQHDLYKIVSFCFDNSPCPETLAIFTAQMLLRRKGRVLDAIAHTNLRIRENLDPKDLAIFDHLQKTRKEISDLITPMLVTHRKPKAPNELQKLRKEEEHLETELSYRGALYQPALKEVMLESVQRALPDKGILIELLRYSVFEPIRRDQKSPWKGEHYAAMVLPSSGIPQWFDLGPASVIDTHVYSLLKYLRNSDDEIDKANAEAAKLYDLIISPLNDALGDVHHLFIAPDGKLSLVPFCVLLDKNERRLSENTLISYLNSGRELAFMSKSVSTNKDIFVVAAPDFEADTHSKHSTYQSFVSERGGVFTPLPAAEQEGENIKQLFENVTLCKGPGATVDAIKSIKGPAVLHVATHGIFSPMDVPELIWKQDILPMGDEFLFIHQASKETLANPMFFSGLALAGANKRNTEGNVGILTAQEISELDLRGTQLVVLSACETGLGNVTHGEEFTGMRRALSIAGAATQVTSLWKVSDQATQAFMNHYYRLLIKGNNRIKALTLAQEFMQNDSEHPEWNHPFYWAAFISTGDWRPMTKSLAPRASSAK